MTLRAEHAPGPSGDHPPGGPSRVGTGRWNLTLYVLRGSASAPRHRDALQRLCDAHLAGLAHQTEVVELAEGAPRTDAAEPYVLPTLECADPHGRLRRVVGDLSCTSEVAVALGLPAHRAAP